MIYHQNFSQGLEEILIRPMTSHASSLWYIYALLVLQLLSPAALWLSRNRLEPLLGVALVLHFLLRTPLFCLDRVCEHAFVFAAGGYAVSHSSVWTAFVDRFRNYTFATFIGVLIASGVLVCAELPNRVGVYSGLAWPLPPSPLAVVVLAVVVRQIHVCNLP